MQMARRTALASLAALPAAAQERFPERPIRLIVPFGPGGGLDVHFRLLGEIAGRRLGQPVVVENRAGATGTLGVIAMKAARPDGYTLTQIPSAAFRIPQMTDRPAFDPLADLTYIIRISGVVMGIVVRADSPWRSLDELLAHARATPGGMNYGSIGVASLQHLIMEQIGEARGAGWTHVPYRGSAEALTALLGRQVDAVAADSSWGPMVEDGSLRLLCTWGEARAPRFPQAPTLHELGLNITASAPYGIVGPAGMPPAVVATLHDAFREALFDPAHLAMLERQALPVMYLNSADYTAAARAQFAEERALLARAGLLAR